MNAFRSSLLVLTYLCVCGSTQAAPANPPTVPADRKDGARVWEFTGTDIGPDWHREADARTRPEAVVVKNGKVGITARAKTWDRAKITTSDRQFGPGTYTWRVHVPKMGAGDMASVGAFIYRDDKHELDFEIGPGTAELRRKLKTAPDELVCYCTNQSFPYHTTTINVKGGAWFTLSLSLEPQKDGNLLARWFIDGRKVKELQTQIPAATRFGIHCSVENLKFLGDHQPLRDHQAVFDRVGFTPAATR